jgi:hypothetical protein
LKVSQGAAGLADGYDFGVRRGVVRADHLVHAGSDHAAVLYDQRGEGAAARAHAGGGQFNRLFHEPVHHFSNSTTARLFQESNGFQRCV